MSKFGDNVVVRKYRKLGEFTAIAVMCDESNNKWWRVRHDGDTIDLGIKTFSNIEKVRFDDGEFYEIQESRTCENCKHWWSQIVDHPNYRICNQDDLATTLQDCNKDFGCNKFERKIND